MPNSEGQLSAAEIAALYALVRAQAAIREQLARIAVAGALAPLRLVNWYDPADVAQAVERALRVVQPAQLRMAQVTDASMARALSIATGRPARPAGAVDITTLRRLVTPAVARAVAAAPRVEIEPEGNLDLDRFFGDAEEEDRRVAEEGRRAEEQARRDDDRRERERREDAEREARVVALDPMEPYMRIGSLVRYRYSQGASESEVREEAAERVERVADMDVSLAQRAQEAAFIRRTNPDQVIGYRRILQPELGGGGPPCGLCVVAADRLYKREDLKPIHDRCRCAVMVATRSADPGQELNAQDLERLYEAAGGTTSGRALKRLRVGAGEHGELGPILFPYGRGFRDAEESESDQRAGSIERRLQGLERSTTALEGKLAEGETRLRPLVGYQQRLIAQLREQLTS